MTATRHSTNLINMKKPPNKMYRTERSTEKQKRDRFFSSGSVTYEQWNRQCTAQYKVAYWEWKERQQLARNHTMAQRSRNTKQTTGYPGTGKRAAQVVRVQSAKRKVVPSQKVHTDRPTQKSDRKPLETFCNNVDADSKLLGTPSSNKELPVDMNDPGASRDENVPGLADKTEAKSCTFAGQRRRKRDSQERLVVELTIPPSQYWAIVEGVATMSDTEDRASFLEQIILEGRSENLPKDGRLLELMPLEAMPGKWTLDLKSTTGNDLLHDDYDLLREDWSTKRLVVRHESHQHVQNNTPTSWNGYSKATVDPSNHRVGSMMSQGILLNEESISIVFAVSLIAFEGFFSAHECRLSALPVARKTLQNLHWGDGFPPKMISIPQFESELEGAFASQSYKIVAAGGAGLIGCFVDDIFKSMTDYKIDVICHDASNQVVGMDFCFRNCRSWNPDASPPTSLGSAAKRPRSAALTSTNLECHLKSLPKDAESLSEPMPQESDAVSGNDDQTSGDSGTLGDQNYSSDNSHAHSSSVPESNLVLEQHIPLRIQDQPEKLVHGVSGVDEITSRSSGWKKCESGNLSHEDSCDNDEVNLSPAFENTFLPEQHDLVRIHDRSNELEDEVSALDRKASPASEWKQRKNANRVSLETLPATFGNGSVLKYAGMSADTNECDRLTTNNKFSSVSSLMKSLQKRHSRKNDSAVRLITPATNTQVTKMLVDIAQKIETQGSRRPQVAREQSLINGAMHSVVKPMKLDFQPETTQISSGRATLQEKEDGVQGTTNHHSRLLVPPSARKPEASTDHVAADDYRSTKCNHVSCPLTWKDYFPSIHDVFYGVHDIDDQVEATAAMLLAYECPDPPHSTLDSWLFHLGGYLFPDSNDDEECEASNGDIQSRNRGWYFFQVCFHDFFFGVHDELHHIEIPPYELSSIVMVNLCSLNSPLFSWFGELWDDAAAPIDSCEFFFFNWFLAIVCLLAFLPLLQHFADYLLLFDLPHDNTDVCHPERVGYWSSYACEYLPVYWVSYFIQAPK